MSLLETLHSRNVIHVAMHKWKISPCVKIYLFITCSACVIVLFQKLRSVQLETTSLDSYSTGEESSISSCLNNVGVLLVTVNAEGASGINLVSTVPLT